MEEDWAANQRSAFSLSLTLALYISNGFGLSLLVHSNLYIIPLQLGPNPLLIYSANVKDSENADR